jgi:Tautomerase enzyme
MRCWTHLYRELVEELGACGIGQNDIVVSLVANSDADWSFGNGLAQFLTGEL